MRAQFVFLLFLFSLPAWTYQDQVPDRLVYAWISNNADFDSLLILNNPGQEAATVTLTARRSTGDPESVTLEIPAQGFMREQASELFQGLGQGPGYTVTAASATTGLKGRWITFNRGTGTAGSPAQGVAISLEHLDEGQNAGHSVLFGYLPSDASFISAPVIVNLGEEAAPVFLQGYDENGTLVFEDNTRLANQQPLVPFAFVREDLIPPGSGDIQLIARSPAPITGVVFVFNDAREPAIGNVTALGEPAAVPKPFAFDFLTDAEGWQGGFADYPEGDEDFYELVSDYRDLPPELGVPGGGLYIAGNNHSDDLFMFVKRQVTGLAPQTTYELSFTVIMATNSPQDCFGVGGAPGESVYFKVGASTIEPMAVPGDLFLRMNIDKGNQSEGGNDMIMLDHVGVPTECNDPQFMFKAFQQGDRAFTVTTDDTGSVWLIMGTDSGFEATTEIFFTGMEAQFTPVDEDP